MSATSLASFVNRIRSERGPLAAVPGFDPQNGNEKAKFLLVLEVPGPKACATGYVSFENPDATAANLRYQLSEAGVDRKDIALWNVVPWYVGNEAKTLIRAPTREEVQIGTEYLKLLIGLLPKLRCVVLVGSTARQAHIALSSMTDARILACHHPSPRVHNGNPKATAENVAIFRHMCTAQNDG